MKKYTIFGLLFVLAGIALTGLSGCCKSCKKDDGKTCSSSCHKKCPRCDKKNCTCDK